MVRKAEVEDRLYSELTHHLLYLVRLAHPVCEREQPIHATPGQTPLGAAPVRVNHSSLTCF